MGLHSSLKVISGIFLLLAASLVHAGEGEQRLDRFLGGLKTLRAEFTQTLMEADGTVLEESRGELLVKRPGRFRLEYLQPYRQTYVADGERIWMYDQDLEQVTVREQGEALDSTPALLLSGTRPIDESFRVVELGEHEGFVWLELRPIKADASFEYVRLALTTDRLQAMEMVDGLGQITRLYLEAIERNPGIREAAFRFEPPAGVDVIGEDS